MKAPNVEPGDWRPSEFGVLNQDKHAFISVDCERVDHDHPTMTLVASSKSLAACLNKQMERLNAIESWEFILRLTRQEMVEEMRKALLEAGYTE